MADTLDVVTLAEAKAVLKITTVDAARDTRLERVITAASRKLDDICGSIVKRTIAAKTYEPAAWDLWVEPSPIYTTPAITLTEYTTAGVAQVLTLETFDTKPTHGYRLQPRSGLGGGYTGRIRRTEGSIASTWGTVRITYDAGRYAATANVDPVFKEAAAVVLINWWQQILSTEGARTEGEFDVPGYRFPSFAVPKAAVELLGDEVDRAHALA